MQELYVPQMIYLMATMTYLKQLLLIMALLESLCKFETGISLMKFLNTYGDVPGTAYALSGSSWINAKIFG